MLDTKTLEQIDSEKKNSQEHVRGKDWRERE